MGVIGRALGSGAIASVGEAGRRPLGGFRRQCHPRDGTEPGGLSHGAGGRGGGIPPRGRHALRPVRQRPEPAAPAADGDSARVGLFVFAMADPSGFSARMVGLAEVPEPLWWLLGGHRRLLFRRAGSYITAACRGAGGRPAGGRHSAAVARHRQVTGPRPTPRFSDWGEWDSGKAFGVHAGGRTRALTATPAMTARQSVIVGREDSHGGPKGDTDLRLRAPIPGRLAIFLDFDGCLRGPGGGVRRMWIVPSALLPVLHRLWHRSHGAVAGGLGGRPVAELRRFLPGLGLPLCGSHGAERSVNGRSTERMSVDRDMLAEAARRAEAELMSQAGLLLERKPVGLGLHYRGAPRRAAEVSDLAERLLPGLPGFHAHHGKMVVELRPDGIGRGQRPGRPDEARPVPAPQAGHVRRRRDGRARLRGRQPPWRAFCEDRAWPDCRASPARGAHGNCGGLLARLARQGGGGVSDSTSEKRPPRRGLEPPAAWRQPFGRPRRRAGRDAGAVGRHLGLAHRATSSTRPRRS